MRRIWTEVAAILLAVMVLGGCATSKDQLLPHGDTGRNDDDEHPQRDPEQCFFRHSANFFAKI